MIRRLLIAALLLLTSGAALAGPQWYKGVTHIHSLWSDGDMAPELIAAWYKDHGYDFICPSDHNSVQLGEKLVPVSEKGKLTPARLEMIRARFGADWLDLVEKDGKQLMRLKTHDALAACFNEPGKFLMIQAEEITSGGGGPHVNGINLRELVRPRAGEVSMLLNLYMDEVHEQRERLEIPMIAHVNHVNFSQGVSTEQLLDVRRLQFMEIYNGHPSVRFGGSATLGMPSEERHWDTLLSLRIPKEPDFILYGMSTDDSHNYHALGPKLSNAGRGWVMVRSESLESSALVEALRRGDFYSTTGVTLEDVRVDRKRYRIDVAAEEGVAYTIEFIGTRKGFDTSSKAPAVNPKGGTPRPSRVYSDDIGVVLKRVEGARGAYRYAGDEIYVRARITSTKAQENPAGKEAVEVAWTQPARLVE